MSEVSNTQAMSNRVAKQAIYALARLGGIEGGEFCCRNIVRRGPGGGGGGGVASFVLSQCCDFVRGGA